MGFQDPWLGVIDVTSRGVRDIAMEEYGTGSWHSILLSGFCMMALRLPGLEGPNALNRVLDAARNASKSVLKPSAVIASTLPCSPTQRVQVPNI